MRKGEKEKTNKPPLLGNMHPNSKLTASPHHAITAPSTHSSRLSPMLPTDAAMAPGVAKMPDPMTREMSRM